MQSAEGIENCVQTVHKQTRQEMSYDILGHREHIYIESRNFVTLCDYVRGELFMYYVLCILTTV